MGDLSELAGRYIAVWNEPAESKRAAAISDVFTADATYTDPSPAVQGHDGIGALTAGARDRFEGFHFKVLGQADAHHPIARFRWEPASACGGESIVIGFDVAVSDGAGRIKAVHGFLDKVPPES